MYIVKIFRLGTLVKQVKVKAETALEACNTAEIKGNLLYFYEARHCIEHGTWDLITGDFS